MVLDEILTHLDTRGREAVGAVLRKMVSLSSSSASWGDGGGEVERREEYSGLTQTQTQTFIEGEGDDAGLHLLDMLTPLPYDTLILILQDFAAAELEESFDHVDVVTRYWCSGPESQVTWSLKCANFYGAMRMLMMKPLFSFNGLLFAEIKNVFLFVS